MKNLIVTAAIVMITLNSVMAQERVNGSVARSFDQKFPGAERTSWTILQKSIHKAQFSQQGIGWLAFFDAHGALICSGRRIKDTGHLPLTVQRTFQDRKQRLEKRYGDLSVVYLYEMVSGDGTKYYSTLDNGTIQLTISMSTDGGSVLEKKEVKAPQPGVPPKARDIIAKKD